MKNIILTILVVCASLFLHACSSTIERDARRAAEANILSMKHTENYEMEDAEKAYKEVIAVLDKYKNTEDYKEFHTLYIRYINEMQASR